MNKPALAAASANFLPGNPAKRSPTANLRVRPRVQPEPVAPGVRLCLDRAGYALCWLPADHPGGHQRRGMGRQGWQALLDLQRFGRIVSPGARFRCRVLRHLALVHDVGGGRLELTDSGRDCLGTYGSVACAELAATLPMLEQWGDRFSPSVVFFARRVRELLRITAERLEQDGLPRPGWLVDCPPQPEMRSAPLIVVEECEHCGGAILREREKA